MIGMDVVCIWHENFLRFEVIEHLGNTPDQFACRHPIKFRGGKLQLLRCYQSELGEFPFPRSESAVRALAQVRGAQSGFIAAEAFQLLRDRY